MVATWHGNQEEKYSYLTAMPFYFERIVILGQRTEYVINSTNAVRLVWTINGYDFDEKNILDNVSPQHEIWVEPTNLSEVGVTFTIQVIAYDANGRSESAEKYFIVASE